MNTRFRSQRYMAPDDEPGSGGGATLADPPAVAPAPPAPAAPAAKAPAAPAPDTPGFWNDGWRDRLAAGDEKALKQLQRYGSPEDIWKKARALESRLSSGELKPVLNKDATPEEVTQWRKDHGIPEAHDKYDIKGVKIDESDKALVDHVLKAAHAANATPDVVKAVVGVWPQLKQQAAEAQAKFDTDAQTKGEDELRGEWGNDYRKHINMVHGMLDGIMPQEVKDQLMSGRLSDGQPIGSSSAVLKGLLQLALIQNPSGLVVPGGTNQMESLETEIAKIEKTMGTKDYTNNEKVQQRYRDLIDARETMKARAK